MKKIYAPQKLYKAAFSLLEVMMALVVVTIMLAVMAPVLTNKKPAEAPPAKVQVMDSTPVGVIVAWYGENFPEGWIPLDGRDILSPEYDDLRTALEGLEQLPDINSAMGGINSPITWIIKAKK